MKKKSAFLLSVLLASIFLSMKGYSQDLVDPTTLNNKIMAGYQGWFGSG